MSFDSTNLRFNCNTHNFIFKIQLCKLCYTIHCNSQTTVPVFLLFVMNAFEYEYLSFRCFFFWVIFFCFRQSSILKHAIFKWPYTSIAWAKNQQITLKKSVKIATKPTSARSVHLKHQVKTNLIVSFSWCHEPPAHSP